MDATELLLKAIFSVREANANLVDVFRMTFDAEDFGVGGTYHGSSSVAFVDDVLVVADNLLQFGEGVLIGQFFYWFFLVRRVWVFRVTFLGFHS
jgi:hypothetical protein